MGALRFAVLLLLLGALCVQASELERRGKSKRSHWKRSKWCGNLDCPQYRVEKEYDDYEIRTYRRSRWVVTDESGPSYEVAALKGVQRLRQYFDGMNKEGDRLRHTRPVVSGVELEEGHAAIHKNFTFAMYLPDRYQGRKGHRAPRPLDPSLRLEKWEKSTLYVRSFPGFATEATILNQMSQLVDSLEEDERDYEDREAWVAVYDPPYRLLNRRNELAVEVAPRKKWVEE